MSDVHRFRMAMAKHLGKVISSQMAAQIEAETFSRPSQRTDPPTVEAPERAAWPRSVPLEELEHEPAS